MLAELAKALGSKNIDHRIKQLDFADSPVAEAFDLSVADIENAKTIILVGCNIRHELPLLHQRIHKAVKRGAKVSCHQSGRLRIQLRVGRQNHRAAVEDRRAAVQHCGARLG